MKVEIRRTGGFAGLEEELASLDTAKMSPDQARQLEERIRSMAFFGLASSFGTHITGADLYRFRITVEDGSRRHTVEFPDHDCPELTPLRELAQTLVR